jgi:hypothetical protein
LTPAAPGMTSLIETVKDYIEAMLSELPGRKALIMDKETLSNSIFINDFSDCFFGLFTNIDLTKRCIFH